jgi:hypothetical protein
MEDRDLFYRREEVVPREPMLVQRKSKERVFTDPFILTCLVIQIVMIIIVLVLHFT